MNFDNKQLWLQVEAAVGKSLDDAVNKYFNADQPGAKELLDWAQQKFECCGRNGSAEYSSSTSSNDTCTTGGVKSCYSDNTCSGNLFTKGCEASFADFVRHNLAVIGAVALGIAFIQVSYQFRLSNIRYLTPSMIQLV